MAKIFNSKPLALIGIMFAFQTFISTSSSAKEIRVGTVFRMNDKYDPLVSHLVRGIEIAKQVYEKDHPTSKITLVPFSHNKTLDDVSNTANNILKSNLKAVIGGEKSTEVFVLGEKLKSKGIVLITPTATNPDITANNPNVFMMAASDKQVAKTLANYVTSKISPKNLGVVHNISDPYTNYLTSAFLENIKNLPTNKKPNLIIEKMLRETVDFTAAINNFKSNGVSHVAFFGFQSDLGHFTNQAAKLNFFPTFIGSDGWGADENVYDLFVKKSPNGKMFKGLRNSFWHKESNKTILKKMASIYKSKFNEPADAWVAVGFDAATILFTAFNNAKEDASSSDIEKQLRKTKGLSLVTVDNFEFGLDNSPIKDMYIYEIGPSGIIFKESLK